MATADVETAESSAPAPTEPPARLPMLGRRRELPCAPRRAPLVVAGRSRRLGHGRGRDRQVTPRGDARRRGRRRRGHRPRGTRVPCRGVDRLRADRGVAPLGVRAWQGRPGASPRSHRPPCGGRAARAPARRRDRGGRRNGIRRRSRRARQAARGDRDGPRGDRPRSRAGRRRRSRTCSGRTTRRARRSCTWPGGSRRGRCSCCSRGAPRTWRPEPRRSRSAIAGLPGATSVRLERLDDVVVGALVEAAAVAGLPSWDAAALAAESEGLPLYVVEALMAGPGADRHAPPRGVRTLLRERLASVSETASQVLAAGAVIGRSFDFATVRGASGRSEDETVTALEELVRRGIVREVASGGEPAFDFGHARLARRRVRGDRAGASPAAPPARGGGHPRGAAGSRRARVALPRSPATSSRPAGTRRPPRRIARRAFGHGACTRTGRPWSTSGTALALGHPDVAGLQVAIGEVRSALGDYAGAVAALEAAAGLVADAALPADRAAARTGARAPR